MPRPENIEDIELMFRGGFVPSAPDLPDRSLENTIKDALNVWLRPLGGIEVAKGPAQVSSQNVGARLFAIGESNSRRAAFAGGLVSGRLPFAGIMRLDNAVLFFLSELTSQQVYLDEVAISGLTTSSVSGGLRIAVPAGGGTYTVYDPGFDPPILPGGNVTITSGGTKGMLGSTGIGLCAWRSMTNATSAPSNLIFKSCVPGITDLFKVQLTSPVSGQDGFVLVGGRWGDQSGDVRVIRFIYIQPRGTFTATNGSPNLTAGVGTFWLQDLRPGDVVTIDGGSYTIATVTANGTATLTGNFTGSTGSGKTMTMTTAAADWLNGELGSLIERDAFKPPRAAGVAIYGDRVFLWGTYGDSGSPTGNAITPTLRNNPEHVGRINILTKSGSDVINVLAGKRVLYVMTTTSLEVVTFTDIEDSPFDISVEGEPGFKSPKNGLIYKNRFYGYSDKPVRMGPDGNLDIEFAEPVWTRMKNWNGQNVVLGIDPKQECVLYCHYDGSTMTDVIPFMTQQEYWGAPHGFAGQITDMTVVNAIGYFTLLSGGNYRVQQWEGGTGAIGAWIAGQYYDIGQSRRYRIKGLIPTCKANILRIYLHRPGGIIPDVSNPAAASASFTLSNLDISEPIIGTHLEGRAMAFRLDFPTDGSFDKIIPMGYPLSERR